MMNIAVIFAGGVGSRMHSKERPKQFLEMYNKPIIIHTLEHFQIIRRLTQLLWCVSKAGFRIWTNCFTNSELKSEKIVPGGETGQLSIYHGLKAAKEVANEEKAVVLIHDGVRPLITEKLITNNIESVMHYGSAITTAKVKETILVVNEEDSSIDYVPSRNNSRVAKAPQSFGWMIFFLRMKRR